MSLAIIEPASTSNAPISLDHPSCIAMPPFGETKEQMAFYWSVWNAAVQAAHVERMRAMASERSTVERAIVHAGAAMGYLTVGWRREELGWPAADGGQGIGHNKDMSNRVRQFNGTET